MGSSQHQQNLASTTTTSQIDLSSVPIYPGTNTSLMDVDLEEAFPGVEKPWRRPGADITDYFNFGFNEFSWRQYCTKQKVLREEFGAAHGARKIVLERGPAPPVAPSNMQASPYPPMMHHHHPPHHHPSQSSKYHQMPMHQPPPSINPSHPPPMAYPPPPPPPLHHHHHHHHDNSSSRYRSKSRERFRRDRSRSRSRDRERRSRR